MSQPCLLALLYGFTLAGVAFNLIVFFCAKRKRGDAQGLAIRQQEVENSLQALQRTVDGLAGQAGDSQEQTITAPAPAAPTAGLNMTKRSQALRMHRKGDTADRIAAVLNIPVQEVDLLLKVNRIIIKNF
jgi:hypothetical protein